MFLCSAIFFAFINSPSVRLVWKVIHSSFRNVKFLECSREFIACSKCNILNSVTFILIHGRKNSNNRMICIFCPNPCNLLFSERCPSVCVFSVSRAISQVFSSAYNVNVCILVTRVYVSISLLLFNRKLTY